MKNRIFGAGAHFRGGHWTSFLSRELTYKIAIKSPNFVAQFPGVFELGECEYGVGIDSFLEHKLVGNVGLSEMVTVSLSGDFLKVFDSCCGFMLYRNQKDESSIKYNRPDDTVVSNEATVYKNEDKGSLSDEKDARLSLVDKMDKDALKVFPENSQSIIGMTTFPDKINVYSIDYDMATAAFSTQVINSYNLRNLNERVEFIKDLFKMSEWMSTVKGPQTPFHLVWNHRQETKNGHVIKWAMGGLTKWLNTSSTRSGPKKMETTLALIKKVYDSKHPNLEQGSVEAPNILKISRVGFQLNRAIRTRMISKEDAIRGIQEGIFLLYY